MSNLLVVNRTSGETRVALVEDGAISEFYLERNRDRGTVGNIYKGRVLSVLPGMQAAFVDIGQEKAGFLHVSDYFNFKDDVAAAKDSTDDEWPPSSRSKNKRYAPIQEVLKQGQEVIVQVAKDAMGTKGARLTGNISMPGRYVVFMPTVSHIGISKRISSERERKRLRRIVERSRPKGAGFIVRTVSNFVPEEKLQHDIDYLIKQWVEILENFNKGRAPQLLNEEPDLALRATRDLFSSDMEALIVDDQETYDRVRAFTQQFLPNATEMVEFYDKDEPIFDAYGIEDEINRALKREVDLPSGGHLVIDKTEALTAIDVNTGKFVGSSSSHEETVYKTNLEAAAEVVYQLRLRNIGGLIIIDFIDMDQQRNREKVYSLLEKELEKDKVTSNTLAISEFGLVEMTRKRVRESIVQQLAEECPYCEGRGFTKSRETIAFDILREVKREAMSFTSPHVHIHAHPDVITTLRNKEKQAIQFIEQRWKKKLHLHSLQDSHMEKFTVSMSNTEGDKKD